MNNIPVEQMKIFYCPLYMNMMPALLTVFTII